MSRNSGIQLGFNVSVEVTNTGAAYAVEVAQLYLTYPEAAGEPPLQLRGFESVALKPGATAAATFALPPRAFSIWSTAQHAWEVVGGTFTVSVGQAVDNLLAHTTIHVGQGA